MELKDLVGAHVLDAVDEDNTQVQTWGDQFEQAQIIRFRLDGIVYSAVEDPSDGYRSCMDTIAVGGGDMKNVFNGQKVVGRMRTDFDYGEDDVLEFVDVVTGNVVLSVGTTNTDDYYPCFEATFSPENMACNQRK